MWISPHWIMPYRDKQGFIDIVDSVKPKHKVDWLRIHQFNADDWEIVPEEELVVIMRAREIANG